MVDGGSVAFAVVYSDGEREINVGNVAVDPSLNFKTLVSVLSRKIGISPHQLSVYLATLGSDRKIPITGKVNFAAIARDEGASSFFFFVKRSRRSKKNHAHAHNKDSQPNKRNPPENVMLLRRSTATDVDDMHLSGLEKATHLPVLDRVEYERRMWNLRMERERYLMNMGLDRAFMGREPSNGGGGGGNYGGVGSRGGGVACEECSRAKQTGRDEGFHWCVYDAVTVGFRSPAGPVARPVKKSG